MTPSKETNKIPFQWLPPKEEICELFGKELRIILLKKFTELLKEYIQVNESRKTMSEQNEKFNKEIGNHY